MVKKKAKAKKPKRSSAKRIDPALHEGSAIPGALVVAASAAPPIVPIDELPDVQSLADKIVPAAVPPPAGRRTPAVFITGRAAMMSDLDRYAASIPPRNPGVIRFAGIDLGTNCGVAFADFNPARPDHVAIVMGQWDLSLGPYDSGPLRHIRFKHFLAILSPDIVTYEEVKFTPAAAMRGLPVTVLMARLSTAAEFLGGLKTTLTVWCEERQIAAHGLGIAEIKKFATGKGNASKVDMINAANAQFGVNMDAESYEQTGVDNIADAAFCLKFGIDHYREAFQLPTVTSGGDP